MVIALYGVSIRGTAPRARSEPTLPFNHVPDGIANCRDESRRMASVSSPDAATPVIGCRLQILCPVRRADRSGRYWPGRYRTSSDREAQQFRVVVARLIAMTAPLPGTAIQKSGNPALLHLMDQFHFRMGVSEPKRLIVGHSRSVAMRPPVLHDQ